MIKKTDFLVIGSGIAGLSFALKASKYGKVTLITKSVVNETNTYYAQGGVASVMYKPDHFDKHIQDTINAGAGLCNKQVVESVVKEAPGRIKELIDWGVDFDKHKDGKYHLGKEGGHSEHRILHHKDNTGQEIQKTLTQKVKEEKNIELLEHCFAIDILTQHHLGRKVKRNHTDIECYGVYMLDLNTTNIYTVLSKVTLIATGGSGNLYQTTTNPSVATGDGVSMVYRAKGIIENMEFVQFHPTSLYNPKERPSFLITEALRGFGAVLKTFDGDEFMFKYDPRGSLAPRDIVARAIDQEMKNHGIEHVFLDCTHLNPVSLANHFPNITEKCKALDIDITKDMIPVVPAAHYQCGGIKVDINGQSTIHNLYAAGEVASTGLHGANRLASNSLLEAIVYIERILKHSVQKLGQIKLKDDIPIWKVQGADYPPEKVMITQNFKEIQQIMSHYVGIVRSGTRLNRALARLEIIYKETENLYKNSLLSKPLCELRNAINVCYLIIKMASNRRESIGLHYSVDYLENE